MKKYLERETKMTITKEHELLKTINLYEIPIGKQSFIATIEKLRDETEFGYWNNLIEIPYVYLNNIRILIDKVWYNVECSGNEVRSKVGKRLKKLNLEENDIISFNANVECELISFCDIEGENSTDIDKEHSKTQDEWFLDEFYIPRTVLPKNYKGTVFVDVYETEFRYSFREYKDNYTLRLSRQSFDKGIKELNFKHTNPNNTHVHFSEVQRTYYEGRKIKNLSDIEKY